MLAGHAARQIACDGSLSGPHPSWKRVSAAGNDGFGRRRETSRPRVTISVFALPIASERGPWGLHCALFVHSRKAFSLSLSLSFFFFLSVAGGIETREVQRHVLWERCACFCCKTTWSADWGP